MISHYGFISENINHIGVLFDHDLFENLSFNEKGFLSTFPHRNFLAPLAFFHFILKPFDQEIKQQKP